MAVNHSEPSRRSGATLASRPLVPVAALFIAGILLHRVMPPWPVIWIAAAAGAVLGSAGCSSVRKLERGPQATFAAALLAIATLLAGLAAAQLHAFFFSRDDIAQFTADQRRPAKLELRIIEPPRILRGKPADLRPLPPRQVAQAAAQRILTRDGWKPASGTLLLELARPHPDLALGQTVIAFGMLQRPSAAMNPGQFDWSAYYREQRIVACMQVDEVRCLHIAAPPAFMPLAWLRLEARRLLASGFADSRSLDHALLRALVLGDADPQLRDIQDDFVRTGTSHHLAISGTHIMVVGLLVFGLCHAFRLAPRTTTFFTLAIVLLYGVLVMPSPPVVRSVLLAIAFTIAVLRRRNSDGPQLLAASVLAMLIYRPLDLYSSGFQLSFLTVLGLMTCTGPVLQWLATFEDPDFRIARSFRRLTPLQAAMAEAGRGIRQVLVAGGVAWIVSAPLILYHFNQLNPYAVAAGIVLIIPVTLALAAGLLKIILTLLLPWFAVTWATLAGAPVGLMRRIVEWLATLPGSELPLATPPIWLVVLLYLLILLPMFPFRSVTVRRGMRCAPAAATALIVALPFLLVGVTIHRREPRLVLLSVGAGQCAVLHLPSGKTVLIDAGSASMPDLPGRCLAPYLKHLGLNRIDAAFISHANYDHYGGIADAIGRLGIRRIYVSPFLRRQLDGTAGQALSDALDRGPVIVEQLHAGQRVLLDAQTACDVLWPGADQSIDANNDSLVLRVTCNNRSILFTGDIQEPAIRRAAAWPQSAPVDILIAPHHGSTEPSTPLLLRTFRPRVILASNDSTLSSKQRAFDADCAPHPLFRTHAHGALTVSLSEAEPIRVSGFRSGTHAIDQ